MIRRKARVVQEFAHYADKRYCTMPMWEGPGITVQSLLNRLPTAYANLLKQVNGFVAFRGGFHMRGICDEPEWHSLAAA